MPVTVNDVSNKLGRPLTSTSDVLRAQADIDDAYALAESFELLSDPETPAQFAVIRRVAVRSFRNPDGVMQQTIGPASVSYSSDSRPGVYFTVQDVADMRGRRSGVYSIPLTTPADHRTGSELPDW